MSNARATTPDWDFSLFPTDEDRWGTKAVLLFRLDSPDKCKESPRSTYDRGRELGGMKSARDTLGVRSNSKCNRSGLLGPLSRTSDLVFLCRIFPTRGAANPHSQGWRGGFALSILEK